MTNKINLLPHNIQKMKDVRRKIRLAAAIQAAVFLVSFGLFVFLSIWEAEINKQAAMLSETLRQTSPQRPPSRTTETLVISDVFLTKDSIKHMVAVPCGVWLYTVRYSQGEVVLSAGTFYIMNIITHQDVLGEFFYDIRLTRLSGNIDGSYNYELILITR